MNASLIFVLAAAMVACPPAPAGAVGSAVTMELCTDQGGVLPLYPVAAPAGSRKAYAEAVPGARYGIRVRNNLGCRVGLVIAVDGRNIISGSQSWLGGGERMYVLAPGEVQEFRGWRTAQDKENRFYFTSVADSYAAAFGDTSAMGVVAMAVYREVPPPPPPPPAGGRARTATRNGPQVPSQVPGRRRRRGHRLRRGGLLALVQRGLRPRIPPLGEELHQVRVAGDPGAPGGDPAPGAPHPAEPAVGLGFRSAAAAFLSGRPAIWHSVFKHLY